MPAMLDKLCAVGRVVWWRPIEAGDARARPGRSAARRSLLCERDALPHWQQARRRRSTRAALSGKARQVLEALRTHGASFFADLQHDAGLLRHRKSSRRWPNWSRRAWSPAIPSPACARW